MLGHFLKVGVWILLGISVVYFLHSCYNESQDIRINPVTQSKQWTYDIISIPLGEAMYTVFIDGELNNEAELEIQTQRTTSHPSFNTPDTTFTMLGVMKLPKRRFSMYYNRDDSGPEKFSYRPLKATRGWVRVQIKPVQWLNEDSLRTNPVFKSSKTYPVFD